MHDQHNLTAQAAYSAWLLSTTWQQPLAVTLTLKQAIPTGTGKWEPLTRSHARGVIRYLCNELDRRCYPKSKGKRSGSTKRFAVIEGGEVVRWHYHMLIDCPAHVDPGTFAAWIHEIWSKSIWGYSQIDIQPATPGWVDYMLKFRTKTGYDDCVELDACNGLSDELL